MNEEQKAEFEEEEIVVETVKNLLLWTYRKSRKSQWQ